MKYKITLKGRVYEVEVEHGEAMLLSEYEAKAPVPPAAAQSVQVSPAPAVVPASVPTSPAISDGTKVDSPLPGNVLDVKVSVGQNVKAGDVLVIIEAMKMENEVAAPCDGVVRQIVAAKGTVVSTGDTLLVI